MLWTSETARKNITLIIAFGILSSIDFSRSLFVIYLLDKNTSNSEIGILQAFLFLCTSLLDVPFGYLADRGGRKICLVFGAASLTLAYFLFPFAVSFIGLSLVFFSFGAGFAFISGAKQALLVDGLRQAGPKWEMRYPFFLSLLRGLSTAALAASMAVSGWIFAWMPDAIFLLSALCSAAATVTAFFIGESFERRVQQELKVSITAQLRDFLKSKKGVKLLWFMASMAFYEALCTPFFIFSQAIFLDVGISKTATAAWISAGFSASVVFSFLSGRFRITSYFKLVAVSAFLILASVYLLAFFRSPAAAIFAFFVIQSVPTFVYIHTDAYIHNASQSEIRATFISVHTFLTSAVVAGSYATLGVLGDVTRPPYGAAVLASALIPVSLILLVIYKKYPE